jgi:hypothetical protein
MYFYAARLRSLTMTRFYLYVSSYQVRRGGQERHQAPITRPFNPLSLQFRKSLFVIAS